MHEKIEDFFSGRGWSPFEFQRRAWQAQLEGRSGLINAPTGLGKTMAAWLGSVEEFIREEEQAGRVPFRVTTASLPMPTSGTSRKSSRSSSLRAEMRRLGFTKDGRTQPEVLPAARRKFVRGEGEPIRVLWVTPLRALANDTRASLQEPIDALGLNWTVEMRTGDTTQTLKAKQKEKLPTALVTTPESLTLLLSYPHYREKFATLRTVIVDEWHELIGSKRGVQMELALSRLRGMSPGIRTWGVSATLGNLEQAMDVLLGPQAAGRGVLVRGEEPKSVVIETIVPKDIERFPWSGHLGTRSVQAVIDKILAARTTLLFTNTRSQAEIWFRRLIMECPELVGQLAIHHGSLDRKLRQSVEDLLSQGKLKCVVCTSSLDLGVDFAPVDQVIQVGSPKGVARLLQRAGRSGHRPGEQSRVVGVPTHAFELVEFAAAREAAAAGRIESRLPLDRPLDVLSQHIVTVSCAEQERGFDEDVVKREVRSTHAYRHLTDDDWLWAMDFARRGGPALTAYPHFSRIGEKIDEGSGEVRWKVATDRIARQHRMTIGTITGETSMLIKYLSGKTIGTIEEGFITRLEVGARFVFAGKILEILKVRDMTVYVQRTRKTSGIVPRWDGGRFSLSTQLAGGVRGMIDQAREGKYQSAEMQAARPLLELQGRLSQLPAPDELLVEMIETDDAYNVFIYPFEGRMAHEGLGALLAHRLAKRTPLTVTATSNDYGVVLRSSDPLDLPEKDLRELLEPEGLVEDLLESLNASGLARRQFRDIARIAGLVVPGYPGARKPMKHLQASSEMFFDVFEEFDPSNLLLHQAKREVLEAQLELGRIRSAMTRMQGQRIVMVRTEKGMLTPLAFPIWAEHLRSTSVSSEKWSSMVQKMVLELEESADLRAKAKVKRGGRRPRSAKSGRVSLG